MEARDVFIAYSRRNSRFVDRMVADLKDHQITVWLDRLELEPGDQPRHRIEQAIESCQFFCLIISNASMRSFYVRRLEVEAAFARMIRTGRESFILPVIREMPAEPLPLMLASYQYIDLSRSSNYLKNMNRLVRKLKLEDEHFTGSRLYKSIDTSFTGQMVGVGPIKQIPHHGPAFRLHFEDGRVRTMDTFNHGRPDGTKSVLYDANNRVKEIILFRDNAVVDTWRYIYDSNTGRRVRKLISRPGEKPYVELTYGEDGSRVSERYLNQDGTLDESRGFAIKEWLPRKGMGHEEIWRNANGEIVNRAEEGK